ncbi:DUF6538 domain-containing protein [Methylobacillus methanolivorans]|uniref:DUF6538 domain-containing protein n=1 Tax=Methylobacillus methanolivorans TaxID=1848927 RepID=A0ABW8GKS3_9PROT
MTIQDYIYKVDSTWYFRLTIPKQVRNFIQDNLRSGNDISHIIPEPLQKKYSSKEIKLSLETKDYSVAKKLRDRHLATYNSFFEALLGLISPNETIETARNILDIPTTSQLTVIPNEVIDAHFTNLLHESLNKDDHWRREKNLKLSTLPNFIGIVEDNLRLARQALSINDTTMISGTVVETILKQWGYDPDSVDSDSKNRIREALLKTNIRSLEFALEKSNGQIVETHKVVPKVDIPKAVSLDLILSEWVNAVPRNTKTIKDYSSTFLAFTQFVANKEANKVSRRDILDWRDSLVSDGKLYYKTIVKRVRQVATIFNLAFDNERIKTNPAVRLSVKKPTILNAVREPFSEDDLTKIFSAPIFHGGDISIGGKGAAAYWLPLLALYTGAREEELGQLNIDDIKFEYGSYFIDVNDHNEDHSIKTMNARRMIPIHSKLIEAGFIAYVKQLRSRAITRVFPELTLDSNHKYTANWSKWWSRYLRKTIGIESRTKVFHSFRHNFKDALRLAEIDPELQNIILGHSNSGNQGSVYGGAKKLKLAAQAILKVEYHGLEVPILFKEDQHNV